MAKGRDVVAEAMVYPEGGEPYLDGVKLMNALSPRGQRGQTIGDYFSGIKDKRDKDRAAAAQRSMAQREEEEWLGVDDELDADEEAWKEMMRDRGYTETTPGEWEAPGAAPAAPRPGANMRKLAAEAEYYGPQEEDDYIEMLEGGEPEFDYGDVPDRAHAARQMMMENNAAAIKRLMKGLIKADKGGDLKL